VCISWANKGFDNVKMHGATEKINFIVFLRLGSIEWTDNVT